MEKRVLMILVLSVLVDCSTAEICQTKQCEYHFDVRLSRTMTYTNPHNGKVYNVVQDGGKLIVGSNLVGLDEPDVTGSVIGQDVSVDDVITADGTSRSVITINGGFPGPTIEVMEGAEVVVHVTNHLLTESLSIHWHGQHQRGSPWMDGVSHITQCPLPPGGTLTYRFTASPPGTHWYHSHLANQRQDGLYGALIIHQEQPEVEEVVMMVSDWYLHTAGEVRVMNGAVDEMDRHRAHMSHHNSHKVLTSQIHNVLINGRGRGDIMSDSLPLSQFSVEQGQTYRFRVVHTGADFGYRVSFDGHKLQIVASDGYEIEPVEVDMFFIFPGESIDFLLTAEAHIGRYWVRVLEEMLHEATPGHEHVMSQSPANDSAHVHVHHHHHQTGDVMDGGQDGDIMDEGHDGHTMDDGDVMDLKNDMPHAPHENDGRNKRKAQDHSDHQNKGDLSEGGGKHIEHEDVHGDNDTGHGEAHNMEGRAVLVYKGAKHHSADPTTPEKACDAQSPCRIFNCPGHLYKAGMDCVNFDSIQGAASTNSEMWSDLRLNEPADMDQVFNFILSGNEKARGSSVNGRKFVHPTTPFNEPYPQYEDCGDCMGCTCTSIVDLPADKTVDLVLSNLQGDQPIYAHHPIHLHGHSFAVLYIGYPDYKEGKWCDAEGVICTDKYCDTVIKKHLHQTKRHTLDAKYNTGTPPIKDTLLIPARGFAVVRILTDNPGYWFLHCHVDQHLVDGMGVLIHSSPGEHTPVPGEFPSCSGGGGDPVSRGVRRPLTASVWVVVLFALTMVIVGVILAVCTAIVIRKTRQRRSAQI